MKEIVLPFCVAWIAGMLLTPLVRRMAIKLGLVDRPGARKIHKKPIPRIGGVALFLGSLIGALPFLKENNATVGILIASCFVFIIGLIDDLIDLKARVKLAAQIMASIILLYFGVKINIMTDFISGQGAVPLGLLTYPLTLFWVVGLTNTINLVDGVDGLAGGIVFIALSTLLTVRMMIPQMQEPGLMSNVVVLSASTMGVLLAFLKYNVNPASIFMGDSGAYFLGFLTASLAVVGGAKGSILFPLIIPLIAFGLPVLDVLFAILRRYFRHVPIFQADKEHLHHRLLKRGFSQRETTRFLWKVSSCFGFVAVLVADIPHKGVNAVAGVGLVFMLYSCITQFIRKTNEHKE